MCQKKEEIFISLFLIVFCSIAFWMTLQFAPPDQAFDVGAGFLPQVVLVCIGLLAAVKLIKSCAARETSQEASVNNPRLLRGVFTIMAVGGYCFSFKALGFILATIAYLFIQILIVTPSEKRSIVKAALTAVVTAFVVYALFVYGFSLRLPKGLLTAI